MPLRFYSFTDPAELDAFEVCWTQADATATAKRRQIRLAEGHTICREGRHDYGGIERDISRRLMSNGPLTIAELMGQTNHSHGQIVSALERLRKHGSIVRTGLGEYDSAQNATEVPQNAPRHANGRYREVCVVGRQ